MRNIFRKDFKFPVFPEVKEFRIFPTSVDYYQSDYRAVMESQLELRLWSNSDWPEDDFTAAQNREDLKLHIKDNENHEAYGFMIYGAQDSDCLGSVYINPICREDFSNALELDASLECRVDCWLKTSLSAERKQTIFKEIVKGLNSWNVSWCFAARPSMPDYAFLLVKVGLARFATLKYLDSLKELYFYR